jgi:hemoglobin-like flavoprotein
MSSTSKKLPLSARQKTLVRESFESVREYETSVVVLFYGRLFEIAPETRALFKIDIREQAKKLMETLRTTVDALDRFEELLPVLADLGRSHFTHGVQPYQYEKLRAALLWAFGQALGHEFDREIRAAWDQLLSSISAIMLTGGYFCTMAARMGARMPNRSDFSRSGTASRSRVAVRSCTTASNASPVIPRPRCAAARSIPV